MDAASLIATFRADTGDDVGPTYLWADSELLEFLSGGDEEAAVRAKLLRDQRSSLCRVPLVVGTTEYRIDRRIFQIDRARLQWPDADTNRYHSLTVAALADQELERTRTGRPSGLVHSHSDRRVILDRAPTAAGVLHLEVYRRPLYAIEGTGDEPEIPEQYHRALLHWMKHRAYGKRDSQTFNEKKSLDELTLFERVFGPPVSARQQRARSERRRITTRPERW
jgi:hypothetical protein